MADEEAIERGPRGAAGVVPAAGARTVLVAGASVAALSEPCLAVAGEGVLLAFACGADEEDAAMRLAAQAASRGAVALPLWLERTGEDEARALVARVIEDFGRLDGVLVVAGEEAPEDEAGDAIEGFAGALLHAAAERLGRAQPHVTGRFVVVWRGGADGAARLRERIAALAADGSCPGAGRRWEAHVAVWPCAGTNAAPPSVADGFADATTEAARQLAEWLGAAQSRGGEG